MDINVALDGTKKRDIIFYPGDDLSIILKVYQHDGDSVPITVDNVRFTAPAGQVPMGTPFQIPYNYIGRSAYRIVGEVSGITTTLAYGVLQTPGGWPSVYMWGFDSFPFPPFWFTGKAENITVLDEDQNFVAPVNVESALAELGEFKKEVSASAFEFVLRGSGSPAGVIAAPEGTIYLSSDGGTGTTLYVKESGDATSSGWVALGTSTVVVGTTGTLTTNVLSNTSIQLVFTPAPSAISYEYRVDGGSPIALPSDQIITGLSSSTLYSFEVRGVNGSVSGSWSNVASATTAGSIPEATGTLTATALSEASVQLAFTNAPGSTSHQYRINGGSPVTLASDKIVLGLAAATSYNFEVRGVSGAGFGAWSNVASATTQAAVDPNALFFPAGAYRATWAERANLQTLVNTYGTVIVTGENYASGGPAKVTLTGAQRLIGIPTKTTFPPIEFAAGADGAVLKGGGAATVTFPTSGTVTKNVTVSNLLNSNLLATGATIEDSTFISLMQTAAKFDNSAGGRLRNNKFYRLQTHNAGATGALAGQPAWSFIGNPDKSSFGNVISGFNALGPKYKSMVLYDHDEFSIIGDDTEAYGVANGYAGSVNDAAYDVRRIGDLRRFNRTGNTRDQNVSDTSAEYVTDISLQMPSSGTAPTGEWWELQQTTQSAVFIDYPGTFSYSNVKDVQKASTTKTRLFFNGESGFGLRGTIPATFTGGDLQRLRRNLIDDKPGVTYTRIPKPTFRTIRDPLGASWATGLAGRTDERASLQTQFNTGTVYLEDRAYYIGDSLIINVDATKIIGGGANCVICAKANTFPVFKTNLCPGATERQVKGFDMFDLVLQGGSIGVDYNEPWLQFNSFTFSHVVMRNMATAGHHLNNCFAWDNGQVQYCDFVSCGHAIKSTGTGTGEDATVAYMDKVTFLNCQYINNTVADYRRNKRTDNLSNWVNCWFEGNTTRTFDWNLFQNGNQLVNCVLKNNGGAPTVLSSAQAMYFVACEFNAGALGTGAMVNAGIFEGCDFARGASSTAVMLSNSTFAKLINCTSTDMPVSANMDSTNNFVLIINCDLAPVDAVYEQQMYIKRVGAWADGGVKSAQLTPMGTGGAVNAGTKLFRHRSTGPVGVTTAVDPGITLPLPLGTSVAPTFVQARGNSWRSTSNQVHYVSVPSTFGSGTGIPAEAPAPMTTTTGNGILLTWIAEYTDDRTPTITDTYNNTGWQIGWMDKQITGIPGAEPRMAYAFNPSIVGGSNHVFTINFASGFIIPSMCVAEINGNGGVMSVDAVSYTLADTTSPYTGTMTTLAANTLGFAFARSNDSAATSVAAGTAATGWTLRKDITYTATSPDPTDLARKAGLLTQSFTSAGVKTADVTFTQAQGTDNHGVMMIAIRSMS